MRCWKAPLAEKEIDVKGVRLKVLRRTVRCDAIKISQDALALVCFPKDFVFVQCGVYISIQLNKILPSPKTSGMGTTVPQSALLLCAFGPLKRQGKSFESKVLQFLTLTPRKGGEVVHTWGGHPVTPPLNNDDNPCQHWLTGQ